MKLNIFDRVLDHKGLVEKIDSMIWTRRYSACGTFKLVVPFTNHHRDMLKMGRLITKSTTNTPEVEMAEIRYVNILKNQKGIEQIEVQGRFITGWIGKRIILNPVIVNDRPQNILHRIVRENVISPANSLRRINNITALTAPGITRDMIEYKSEPFINVLLECETAAKASSLGFGIITNLREEKHYFKVYDGRDLTVNQTVNPPCVFSQQFDNIIEQEFINSVENLKTTAYVGGENREDRPRHIVEVGHTASGLDRNETFINATDIVQSFRTSDGMEVTFTDAQVREMLRQRGINDLASFAEILSFSSKINTYSNLVYKEDYDLGDRVTCEDRRWGIQINVQINEIAELYKHNSTDEIEITFGESLPALIDTIRQI